LPHRCPRRRRNGLIARMVRVAVGRLRNVRRREQDALGLRLIVRAFVRRVFSRLRSNSEYRESQGRVHRADARRGSHQAARRTGLVVRTEVRWLSRARSQGRRRRPIAVAQRQRLHQAFRFDRARTRPPRSRISNEASGLRLQTILRRFEKRWRTQELVFDQVAQSPVVRRPRSPPAPLREILFAGSTAQTYLIGQIDEAAKTRCPSS
jgi:hypothetical protein